MGEDDEDVLLYFASAGTARSFCWLLEGCLNPVERLVSTDNRLDSCVAYSA
jgi:hypothetical protein